jgi:cobalt-precorrin 5A hydrolase
MSARIAIGVGCRLGCPADAIEFVVRQALEQISVAGAQGLFTIQDKAREPGLLEAARHLRLDLVPLSREALQAQTAGIRTRSDRAELLFGVASVAEAAALAGAGENAVLIVPRIANQRATCAVAAAGS